MIRDNWSTTSRTGYSPRSPYERFREAVAIICSMVGVAILIAGTIAISRLLGL
jgi:hypothetical protein